MKLLILLISCAIACQGFSQKSYLLVGTYNSQKSEGIYVYEFNNDEGTAKEVSHVISSNPSYIVVSPDKKYVFSVNENSNKNGKGGFITSFLFDNKKGVLTKINTQSSEGNDPCYITIDKTGKWVITGNYSSGNFAILPVGKNGVLDKAIQTVQHYGKSIDITRQNSSHVHSTFFTTNNKVLYVTDLGTDKIIKYNFNKKTGLVKSSPLDFISAEAGSGPRHIDLSKNNKFMYVLNELSGSIAVYPTNNNIKKLQTISSLPFNFKGVAGSADIHISPDGDFLYSSNRGESNSIGIFKINKKTGLLSLVQHQSSLGLTPRNFNFDPTGKYLLVANQNSNEVIIFSRNIKNGLLTDSGNKISIGKPVCLKWIY